MIRFPEFRSHLSLALGACGLAAAVASVPTAAHEPAPARTTPAVAKVPSAEFFKADARVAIVQITPEQFRRMILLDDTDRARLAPPLSAGAITLSQSQKAIEFHECVDASDYTFDDQSGLTFVPATDLVVFPGSTEKSDEQSVPRDWHECGTIFSSYADQPLIRPASQSVVQVQSEAVASNVELPAEISKWSTHLKVLFEILACPSDEPPRAAPIEYVICAGVRDSASDPDLNGGGAGPMDTVVFPESVNDAVRVPSP